MAGMECIPVPGILCPLLNGDDVEVFVSPKDLFGLDFVVGLPLSDLELSEFTLTWSLPLPKFPWTPGELWRLTLGWGIFSPNLFPSSEDEIGLVNARVVIGDCVICAAAAALATRL